MSLAVSSGVTFTGLNTGFEYLPSVSRDVEGALIAPRPKPTKPPKDDDVVSQVTETVSDSVLRKSSHLGPSIHRERSTNMASFG
jgi:hypothetical protein